MIKVKIICDEEETGMSMRCKVSLTAEHCEIAQSQGLRQPKQLGTRNHTYTIVSEHDTEKLHVVKQLVSKMYYFLELMVKTMLEWTNEHSYVAPFFQTWERGNVTDVGLTGLLFLWRLAALRLWHVLCLRLWLCLWVSMGALSFGPGHQAEPCGWAGAGGLQDFTQNGTQCCFLFLL